jgi:hypothetical protein
VDVVGGDVDRRVFYLEDGGSAGNVRYLMYMGFGRKWSLRVCGVYDLRLRDRTRTAGRIRLWDGGRRTEAAAAMVYDGRSSCRLRWLCLGRGPRGSCHIYVELGMH